MDAPTPAGPEAVSLINAAAIAAGQAPEDPAQRAQWVASVGGLAVALYRQAQRTEAELAILAQCRVVPAEIVRVEEVKGRGLITYRSPIGLPVHKAADGTEAIRTHWVNDPRGAAMVALARSLIGRQVEFGKYIEIKKDGTGHEVAMVAWIDAVDAAPAASQDHTVGNVVPQGTSHWTQSAPQSQTPRSAAPPERTPERTESAPQSSAEVHGGPDLAKLRNIALGNYDQLLAAARDHLHFTKEEVGAVEMKRYINGPTTPTQLRLVWNDLIAEYEQGLVSTG